MHTTLAMCVKVVKMLCLAVRKWLLSQCRYWSVGRFVVICDCKSVVRTSGTGVTHQTGTANMQFPSMDPKLPIHQVSSQATYRPHTQ